MKRLKTLLSALSLLLLVCSLAAVLPGPAEAARVLVGINIEESNRYVPTDGAWITIGGYVYCDVSNLGYNLEDVEVEFFADTGGWEYSFEPESVVFVAVFDPQPFTLTLKVPAGLDQSFTRDIVVDANVTVYPANVNANVAPDNFTIRVFQDLDYQLNCAEAEKACGWLSEVTYEIMVKNKGEGPDTVTASFLESQYTLTGEGLMPAFDQVSAYLEPGQSWKLTVTVKAPGPDQDLVGREFRFAAGVESAKALEQGTNAQWSVHLSVMLPETLEVIEEEEQHGSPGFGASGLLWCLTAALALLLAAGRFGKRHPLLLGCRWRRKGR